MNNKWVSLGLTAALLVLLVLGGFWFHRHFKYVHEIKPVPPKGPAAYDPFYAAAQTLKAYGETVVLQPFLSAEEHALKPDDIVVYYGDINHLEAGQLRRLKQWIHAGGQLVVQASMVHDDDAHSWLKQWGVKWAPENQSGSSGCPSVVLSKGEKPQKLDICGAHFMAGNTSSQSVGADSVLANITSGLGTLTVVSTFKFMTNKSLDQPGSARYMLRVLSPNLGHGRIFLIYSVDVAPWPLLLWRYAWPVLVALALLLIAWLAGIIPRFSPIRSKAVQPRRALLEHVRASAETLWRAGDGYALYETVRDEVQRRMRRRYPAVVAMRDHEVVSWLASVSHLPVERVSVVMVSNRDTVNRNFQEYMVTLMQIRNCL